MESMTMTAEKRGQMSGGKTKRLRAEGLIPAVVYGRDIESMPIKIKLTDLRDIVSSGGKNAFFTLNFNGGEHAVIIKEIQYDVIKSDVLHVDLQKVSLTEKIQTGVQIRLVGRDGIEKAGKVLVQQLDEITIECLPQNTPQYLEADVSGLELFESYNIKDLEVPEGIEIVDDLDEVIASLTEVREIVEEEPEEDELLEGEEGEEAEEGEEGEGSEEGQEEEKEE